MCQAANDSTVTAVAITGAGAFYSSGNDLSAFFKSDDPLVMLQKSKPILRQLIRAFYTFPKLLICVVNGPCIGIAATTAFLCDVIYVSDTAYFHTPFTALGLCAEGCASYTFPRILGKSKASEMLMLNHKLTADEAYRLGAVSEIVKNVDLETKLWPRIEQFAQLSTESLQVTKKLMQKFEISKLDAVCDAELDELYQRFGSEAFTDAIVAFMTRKSKL